MKERTKVKFEDTDIATGNRNVIHGTIEAFNGDYVFVVGSDNKFYKVFYNELTYVGRV
jgi:hypothetical protein